MLRSIHQSSGSSSSSAVVHQQRRRDPDEAFINKIQEIIATDPTFADPQRTGNNFLFSVTAYLEGGGNPALLIPTLEIGFVTLTNVNCLELVFRISKSDIKGLKILWDNEGVEINADFQSVLRTGLEIVDEKIEANHLSIDEIVALIQCVITSDPYLSLGSETARRILNLMDQFLAKKGNPTLSIETIRFGHKILHRVTIVELLYLLWTLPYGYELEPEEWEYEGGDWSEDDDEVEEQQEESIMNLFRSTISAFKDRIEYLLEQDKLNDQDFLPLIRCIVEFSDDVRLSKELGKQFLHLMEGFLKKKANPNLVFSLIEIGGSVYKDIACFQVTYLLWKHDEANWSDVLEKRFQILFDAFLSDRRTDLTWRFSEYSLSLGSHHFVNRENIAYYRKNYPKGTKKKPFYFNGELEPDSQFIDQFEGHSLERVTLAHFAVIKNDFITLTALLDREPSLIGMTCCLTKGKASLDRTLDQLSGDQYLLVSHSGQKITDSMLERDDHLSGSLQIFKRKYGRKFVKIEGQIHRITNVTLLHLAARAGREGIFGCLARYKSLLVVTDSDKRIPQHYLKLSIKEKLVESDTISRQIFRMLKPVTKCQNYQPLPSVSFLIHRGEYDLHYDTSRKVAHFAHQRLGKDSFGTATRRNHRWIDNLEIPELNRAMDRDYRHSGYDRGHLVPAQDATRSQETMEDTFHPENAVPQNQILNRGAWSCLESHVHQLALNNELVEVFTGPLFKPTRHAMTYPIIGEGGIHVPTHLFKIILKYNRTRAFEVYILPNAALRSHEEFSDYRIRPPEKGIARIQKWSGILFAEWLAQYS